MIAALIYHLLIHGSLITADWYLLKKNKLKKTNKKADKL